GVVEASAIRAELRSRLFSRVRPAGLSEESSPRDLFDAYALMPHSREIFDRNLAAIVSRLTDTHHFSLTQSDVSSLEYIYRAFYESGPEIRYSAPRQGGGF